MTLKAKLIRACKNSIRRHIGEGKSFENKKLIMTHKYIINITEDTESYMKRKIEWAIKELINKEEKVTRYKVEFFAGVGGECDDNIKNNR